MLWGWLGGIAPEKKQQEGVHTATIEWSPDGLIEQIGRLYSRVEELESIIKAIVVLDDPNEWSVETQCNAEQMREAIEDAVRWHYCDVDCNDGPGGYQGCGIADLALAALEACVTDDLPRLKSEAAQWASLWYRDAAPDTWEEAQVILAAKEGQGEG